MCVACHHIADVARVFATHLHTMSPSAHLFAFGSLLYFIPKFAQFIGTHVLTPLVSILMKPLGEDSCDNAHGITAKNWDDCLVPFRKTACPQTNGLAQ